MSELFFAIVTTLCRDFKIGRILLDKVKHILRRVDNDLDIRPRFPGGVAAAEEIDDRLALRVALSEFLPLCFLVLSGGIFVRD